MSFLLGEKVKKMKKWQKIKQLDCVKQFGLRHAIAHFLGIHYVSRCFMAFGNKLYKNLSVGMNKNNA